MYNHVQVKQFVVEGKGKKKNPHEIEIHLYTPVQMMGENRYNRKDIPTLFPSGHSDLRCHTPGARDWFGCQGWRVLGQSELGACSRGCVPKMNLEFLFPSGETPPPDTAE